MKTEKLYFYSQQILSNLLPREIYQKKLRKTFELIKHYDETAIQARVNYYLKSTVPYRLTPDNSSKPSQISKTHEFRLKNNKSAYYFDLLATLRYFPAHLKFCYLFGDVIHVPDQPTIVKSRPIGENNQNSVLFKLNSVRHFNFVKDPYRYEDKRDIAIFRGACHQEKRQKFLKACLSIPGTDIGDTRQKAKGTAAYKDTISVREHMKYKFIISVEGNDVASNLKWILNSNSLCFMTKPKYETWFMEGTLIPDYHYVRLKDDYADLAEKITYYREHHAEAKRIISNARQFAARFQDRQQEKLISLLVMHHYLMAANPGYRYAEKIKQPVKQTRPVLAPELSSLAD
jgi:hypothetical protein